MNAIKIELPSVEEVEEIERLRLAARVIVGTGLTICQGVVVVVVVIRKQG